MPRKSKPLRFLATIYKIWMMRHIDVPREIADALRKQMATPAAVKPSTGKESKYIPVVATVGGKSTRTTIVPAGGGRHRMQINTAQRKAAKVDWGDAVTVELRIDLASRAVPVPADLRRNARRPSPAIPALARSVEKSGNSAQASGPRHRSLDRARAAEAALKLDGNRAGRRQPVLSMR
jgi:hypothetical protein